MTSVVSRSYTAKGGPIPLPSSKPLALAGPKTPAKATSHRPTLSGTGSGGQEREDDGHGSPMIAGSGLQAITTSTASGIPTLNTGGSNPTAGSNVLDTHRRNHSSSRLPAYRFTDLRKKEAAPLGAGKSGGGSSGNNTSGSSRSKISPVDAPVIGSTTSPLSSLIGVGSRIGTVGGRDGTRNRNRGSSSPNKPQRSNSITAKKRESILVHTHNNESNGQPPAGFNHRRQFSSGFPPVVLQTHIPPSPVSPNPGDSLELGLKQLQHQIGVQIGQNDTTCTPQQHPSLALAAQPASQAAAASSSASSGSSASGTNQSPFHFQLVPSSSHDTLPSARPRACTSQLEVESHTPVATKPLPTDCPSPPESSTNSPAQQRPLSYPESPPAAKFPATAIQNTGNNSNFPSATFLAPAASLSNNLLNLPPSSPSPPSPSPSPPPSSSSSSPPPPLGKPQSLPPTSSTPTTTAPTWIKTRPTHPAAGVDPIPSSTAAGFCIGDTESAEKTTKKSTSHQPGSLLLQQDLHSAAEEELYQHKPQLAVTATPSLVLSATSSTSPGAVPHRSNSDERISSRRPPVSFKPPPGSVPPASGRAVIPPIRAFRSSGSRRSLVLDMNTRNSRSYDFGDDSADSNHRDRTLRALEGRDTDGFSQHQQPTPPDSAARDRGPGEDGGDMFLRIAREEFARKSLDEGRDGSTVSRVTRTSNNRRPFSAAVPTYQAASPPRLSRRLSDQQETKRSRTYDDDRSMEAISRPPPYRETMDRLASATEQSRSRNSTQTCPPKSNPGTPRVVAFQDGVADSPSTHHRRRGSVTDSNNHTSRAFYKNSSLSYSRTYNSSPLVPKHESSDMSHGFESTESTASTNAPSIMWDEVDKMKSQIERIQKKGTLPANSAVSRGSDERPHTATTTVTTMSTSPKRASGNATQAADASSTTSSHKEPAPILQAALSRTKPVLSPEVYHAVEAAANDAMALAGMMGSAGQPGPISSGASSIGNGMAMTDRQLRRKADSVCRSLTELCIALSDGNSRKSPPIIQTIEPSIERETVMSPTATTFLSAPPVRRPSAIEAIHNVSPRNVSRLEERRSNMMNTMSIPSPRFLPNTPTDNTGPGRKSSLLISRTRRAGTEEPEDGRRSSLLLRTRRAGTEEPEEGRKSSLFVRSRRNTLGDEDEESRFRAPSRANTTELAALRALNREREAATAQAAVADPSPGTSTLPRRRLAPSGLGASSRLAAPAATPTTSRRYLERSTPERETVVVADRLSENRGPRQYIRPTGLLARAGSLSRRNRDSTISGLSAAPASNSYR